MPEATRGVSDNVLVEDDHSPAPSASVSTAVYNASSTSSTTTAATSNEVHSSASLLNGGASEHASTPTKTTLSDAAVVNAPSLKSDSPDAKPSTATNNDSNEVHGIQSVSHNNNDSSVNDSHVITDHEGLLDDDEAAAAAAPVHTEVEEYPAAAQVVASTNGHSECESGLNKDGDESVMRNDSDVVGVFGAHV